MLMNESGDVTSCVLLFLHSDNIVDIALFRPSFIYTSTISTEITLNRNNGPVIFPYPEQTSDGLFLPDNTNGRSRYQALLHIRWEASRAQGRSGELDK